MNVYVSGPMTGYVDFNRPAFFAAEEHLASQGWVVVNPARVDLEGIEDVSDWTHAQYLKRDLKMLLDCDAIYLLPGWKYSKGANIEHQTALACGIQILTETDLDLWRTFEGEPIEQDGEPESCCSLPLVAGCDHDEYVDSSTAADLPAQGDGSDALAQEEAEDLSAHPQFGAVFDEDRIRAGAQRLVNAGLVLTLPEGFEPAEPPYFLAEVTEPQPDDEFPNVGYVRRWRALRELRAAHNEGVRRSA